MRHKVTATRIKTGSKKDCYKVQVRRGSSGRGKVIESVTLDKKYSSPGLTIWQLEQKYKNK